MDSKGGDTDPLKLATYMGRLLEQRVCNYFLWDGDSLEWRFDHSSNRGKPATISDTALGVVASFVVGAMFNSELKQKGITSEEFAAACKAAENQLPTRQFVLTTDGRITTNLPADISPDGRTMTLDFWKFRDAPPKDWSLRIEGL